MVLLVDDEPLLGEMMHQGLSRRATPSNANCVWPTFLPSGGAPSASRSRQSR